MRILNRPMFKYGGPIKEGVMHGMRNNYQSGQLVRPGPGRQGYQGDPGFWARFAANYAPRNLTPKKLLSRILPWKKAKAATYVKPAVQNLQGIFTRTGKTPGITGTGAGSAWMTGPANILSKLKKVGPMYTKAWQKAPYTTLAAHAWPLPWAAKGIYEGAKKIPWKELSPLKGWESLIGKKDKVEEEDKIDTGTKIKPIGPGAQFEHTAPILTESQKTKLAKDQQNTRLKSYLDMMGYDQAKRGALDKALIDASAVVQQGTEEAGSLKEADWGKMINKMIQTTSRRLEKPEQIREAVGLMMTKGAIEKDIAEGKGGPLKQNAKDLVAAGVYKTEREAMKHLAKKTSFEDVLIAIAGKQGDVTGAHLEDAWRMSESGIPKARVKATDEIYENFVDKNEKLADIELEFVDRKIKDKQPGDVYVIDDRMVIIQADGTPKYRW